MNPSTRYSLEVRDRGVRLVLEHQGKHGSLWSAILSVASKLGCTAETLRKWGRQGERTATARHQAGFATPATSELLTSALTLGEVLVKPMEIGDEDLMRCYEQAIGAGATVLPFDLRAAPRFAEIRRDRSIRAPDAIQLACASAASTDLFVTNDGRLSRKNIQGIHFIQSLGKVML